MKWRVLQFLWKLISLIITNKIKDNYALKSPNQWESLWNLTVRSILFLNELVCKLIRQNDGVISLEFSFILKKKATTYYNEWKYIKTCKTIIDKPTFSVSKTISTRNNWKMKSMTRVLKNEKKKQTQS